jgi:hypothetical protein
MKIATVVVDVHRPADTGKPAVVVEIAGQGLLMREYKDAAWLRDKITEAMGKAWPEFYPIGRH